jgi:NAD dependent epimerase/dehydratase family enzyme
VVLEGQKVLPNRAQQQGFTFRYTDLGSALANIMKSA